MKNKKNIILFLVLFIIIFSFVLFGQNTFLFAQDYIPLSPLPGSEQVDTSDPGGYFANLFKIFIGVAAILAVIMLMVGGLQYMMSESFGGKESAKKRMWAAVLGIVLLLTSYLILVTINPDLVKLPFSNIKNALKEAVIDPSTGTKNPGGGGGPGSGNAPPVGGGGGIGTPGYYCSGAGCCDLSNFVEGCRVAVPTGPGANVGPENPLAQMCDSLNGTIFIDPTGSYCRNIGGLSPADRQIFDQIQAAGNNPIIITTKTFSNGAEAIYQCTRVGSTNWQPETITTPPGGSPITSPSGPIIITDPSEQGLVDGYKECVNRNPL